MLRTFWRGGWDRFRVIGQKVLAKTVITVEKSMVIAVLSSLKED